MRTAVGVAAALIVALAGLFAFSPRHVAQLAPNRVPVDRMQLNGIVRTDAGLVTAGELGHILISSDGGTSWRDASVTPQRQALITRLVFVDGRTGLALGHEGWILRSSDGGLTWKEVAFDDRNRGPLLAAARLPSGQWLAVGSFGRVLRSGDDGASWQPGTLAEPATDWHLNAIAADAERRHWLVVGESGTVLRSDDAGEHWQVVPPFYNGSLYGAISLGAGRWVAYGMRGNVFHSSDDGLTWAAAQVPVPVSWHAAALAANGQLLLGGEAGTVVASDDGGHSFKVVRSGARETLTGILPLPDGSWLMSSDNGLRLHRPGSAGSGDAAKGGATPKTSGTS